MKICIVTDGKVYSSLFTHFSFVKLDFVFMMNYNFFVLILVIVLKQNIN